MKEFAASAYAYGTRRGDDLWDPCADIKGPEPLVPDGKVDVRDISLVARHSSENTFSRFQRIEDFSTNNI